jgi:hypothetical protein
MVATNLLDEAAHDALDHTGLTGVGGAAAAFVGCIATRTTDQTLTNGADTAVIFNGTDELDTDAFHDPAGANPERIIIPAGKAGKYLISAAVLFAAGTAGYRRLGFTVSGSIIPGRMNVPVISGVGQYLNISVVRALAEADYVELFALQTNGGNLALSGATVPLRLSVTFLGT